MYRKREQTRMKEIAAYVSEGAMAYLKRQYTVVGKIFIILVVLLTILAYMGIQNPFVPVAFLTGGIFLRTLRLSWNENCNMLLQTGQHGLLQNHSTKDYR